VQYVAKEGKFYCEKDYYEHFNPKCGHCEQTIVGPYINAMDKSWCPDHFVCTTCEEGFTDGKFLRHEDRPYCKTCYGDVTSTNCGKW
jgi:hypothetical protein